MNTNLLRIAKFTVYAILLYFSYLMVLITLQYIPVNFDTAFLQIKQEEIAHPYYQVAFFTHVYTSIFVLIAGLLQFSAYLRKHYRNLHRNAGKLCTALVLFCAGPSGLIMGYHANGGLPGRVSFCILACLWMYFTGKAYLFARKRAWNEHRNFMYRSFALTLSAVSLRFIKMVIVALFQLPPMDAYVIAAWSGWTINLLVAEIVLHRLSTINSPQFPRN